MMRSPDVQTMSCSVSRAGRFRTATITRSMADLPPRFFPSPPGVDAPGVAGDADVFRPGLLACALAGRFCKRRGGVGRSGVVSVCLEVEGKSVAGGRGLSECVRSSAHRRVLRCSSRGR